jgi:hypothetical protein
MTRNFAYRVAVFAAVLSLSLIPFWVLGLMTWETAGSWTQVLGEVVQSGEVMVISAGLAAGAAGDLMLSTRAQGFSGRLSGLVLLNFWMAMVFLMFSSNLYAVIAHGVHTERAVAAHQVNLYSAVSFVMSVLVVVSTMLLGEVRDRHGQVTTGQPTVWQRRIHRWLWGQTRIKP